MLCPHYIRTIINIEFFSFHLLFLLSSQNSDVRSQFQEFLSLNGHQLEQRPFPDVVQLALSQPHASEVYRTALQQARERASTGKLYFDWLYENQFPTCRFFLLLLHIAGCCLICSLFMQE